MSLPQLGQRSDTGLRGDEDVIADEILLRVGRVLALELLRGAVPIRAKKKVALARRETLLIKKHGIQCGNFQFVRKLCYYIVFAKVETNP